jgi:hypothetical protein
MQRPTGVTAIGILGIVMSFWTALSLFLPSTRMFFASTPGTIVSFTVLVGALLVAALFAVAGVGILRLKPWARILALIISALYILMSLADMLSGPQAFSRSGATFFYFGNLIEIALSGLIIWYMFQPSQVLNVL